MDILLHLTGLAFLPLMGYILYLGVRDILSGLREHSAPYWPELNTARPLHIVSPKKSLFSMKFFAHRRSYI